MAHGSGLGRRGSGSFHVAGQARYLLWFHILLILALFAAPAARCQRGSLGLECQVFTLFLLVLLPKFLHFELLPIGIFLLSFKEDVLRGA